MIKFKCFIPEVAEYMPLIPTKDYKFGWIYQAKEFYKKTSHNEQTTRCPGIFSLLNTGWIHRTYMDIKIETYRDGNSFKIETSHDQMKIGGDKVSDFVKNYVAVHPSYQLEWVDFPNHSARAIIKIQTPWFVEIPIGYSLLMMPIPYPDDARFTAASGLLKGNNFLNVQLYWNQKEGVEIIKTGTPLNQMILVKDEADDYMIENVPKDELDSYMKENYYLYNKVSKTQYQR